MKIEIAHTITDLDETAWQKLVGSDRVDGAYGWFKTVEESGMRNMHYVLVKNENRTTSGNTLAAAACCRLRTEYFRTMKVPFLDVRPLYFDTPQHIKLLITGLNTLRSQLNAKGILLYSHDVKKLAITQKEFNMSAKFRLLDNTYIDLEFDTFEDYLSWLPSKSRLSVRNTLNKAKRRNITTVFTHELSTWKKETSKLHWYLCKKHNDFSSYVQEDFYEILEKNLKEKAEIVIFLKNDTPLSFALALNSPRTALYKFGGIDPRYRKYQSYFLIYYEGIKRAIERGQSRIYFGPTSYGFKEKIGCKREKGFGIAKMHNPLLNMILQLYILYYKARDKRF